MNSFSRVSGARSRSRAQGLAIASLVCGVLALFVFSLILGPLAILAGYLALRETPRSNAALAKAGIALGIAAMVVYAVMMMIAS
ncbi:DUF4190 domain-containing protein [Streptomyces sp. NPDC091377]|uniref:DUF4190 domain-containing protein n=1 Tax=unclassified Streptomyces TaxID=2593676 RepID=UPI003810FAF7